MGNESSKNTSQETVTISTEDANTIKNLKDQLNSKNKEIQEIKVKTSDAIKKIKEESKKSEQKTSKSEIVTNLPARIIKQDTFGNNFHNGYADGTVKKATKELRATQRKASVGK